MGSDDKKQRGFEVGYCRPPKNRQFKKGESGNPTGRPKRKPQLRRSLLEALLEALDRPMTIEENGKLCEITTKDALMKQAINEFMAGKPRPLKELLAFAAEPLIARAEAEQRAKESSSAHDRVVQKIERMAARFEANAPKKSETPPE